MIGAVTLPVFAAKPKPLDPMVVDHQGGELSEPFWESVQEHFKFADGLRYFNNASLGPSAISTRQATKAFRDTLDEFPSKYMWGAWKEQKEQVRQQVADLFSVSNEEIALIHNTTEGMNLIARSFDLQAGDEVILGDHEHPSGTIPWQVWQESKGVRLVRPQLPLMPKTAEDIVEVYRAAITPKTKLISMCHMVNTNGMILPVKEVSRMAHALGILVAVDGAQAAGMMNINLHDLGCDFYAASAHKWLFSPKGVGIFFARKEKQPSIRPLMVARGYEDASIRRLENYNTRNLPEVLGLGNALKFHREIGSEHISKRHIELKTYFLEAIATRDKLKLKTPSHPQLSSAIQVVEVLGQEAPKIKEQLLSDFTVDCRAMTSFGLNALRFSLAIYITKKDIDYLMAALDTLS